VSNAGTMCTHEDITLNKSELIARVETDEAEFKPMGNLVYEYTLNGEVFQYYKVRTIFLRLADQLQLTTQTST
jgi:hypothetical protein